MAYGLVLILLALVLILPALALVLILPALAQRPCGLFPGPCGLFLSHFMDYGPFLWSVLGSLSPGTH